MKHTIAALLIVLSSGCGLFKFQPPTAPEPEGPDPVALAVENTVAIGNEAEDIFCSGVAVEGTFLTAAHCVMEDGKVDESPFRVRFRGKWYPGVVVTVWPEKDLAIIDAAGAKTRKTLEVSPWEPAYGMFVVYLGFPLGDPHLHLFDGRVSAPVDSHQGYLFDVDGQFIPGNSGGPVLDERGRLLGIVSSTTALPGFPIPQFLPIGHAVRPEFIREILK